MIGISMKKEVSLKTKIALALLLAAIVTNAFSLFFFIRIDNIVHGDLYKYGLQFNYEWAGRYWTCSQLLVNSLIISIILIIMAIASLLIHVRTRNAASRFLCCLLLIAGTTLAVFSAYLFNSLDYIIHHDLYQYGLQFSSEWAIKYWTNCRLILESIGLSIATTLISTPLALLSTRKIIRIEPAKVACSILTTTGVAALALSILWNSSVLAFIGLGLTFWGAVLAYIRTEEYVKGNLLEATALTPLATLNQIIMQELHHEGKAVYLPPKYLKDPEDSKVYIPKQKNGPLPTPEKIHEKGDEIFIENPQGLLLTPPGGELTKLFEKTLETSFTRVDLQYLEQNMPKLFIEDFEIAQNFEMEAESNKIRVKIENSAYKNITKDAARLYGSLGCPLSSAIACALAKATGKLITIESQKISTDGRKMEIEYNLLEEEGTEQ